MYGCITNMFVCFTGFKCHVTNPQEELYEFLNQVDSCEDGKIFPRPFALSSKA